MGRNAEAGKIARGAGHGCITDIILGLVGSILGGWLFMKLGIFGGGFLYRDFHGRPLEFP